MGYYAPMMNDSLHRAVFARILCVVVLVCALVPTSAGAQPWSGSDGDAGGQGGTAPAAFELPADEGAYVSDELLVVLEADAGRSSAQARELEREVDAVQAAEVISDATSASQGGVLKADIAGESIQAVAAELAEREDVAYVQPNFLYRALEDAPDASVAANGASSYVLSTDPSRSASNQEAAGESEPLANSGMEALDGSSLADMSSPNDTSLSSQYYLESFSRYGANVRNAWNLARADNKVTVAVLDTGIYANPLHEDLRSNVLSDYMWDAFSNTTKGRITNYMNVSGDPSGHGTHVAGIVAAEANNGKGIAGTSFNANILPIKVFDNQGATCSTATLIKAYRYLFSLVDTGKVPDLRVVNMSLGGYDEADNDKALEAAIQTARAAYNIVTVCAGGNGWVSSDLEVVRGEAIAGTARTDTIYPGDFEPCVCVTALSTNGTNVLGSDYNRHKDISAPGARVYSTYNAHDRAYAFLSGTSMAAPVVSGVFALLWAACPHLSVDQACEAVYSTAHEIRSNPDRRALSGSHGCIDAYAAILYAKEHFPASSTKPDPEPDPKPNPDPVVPQASWIRIWGANTYSTMEAVVKRGWKATGGTVVVATSASFKDAVAASGVAGLFNAPVLLTGKNALPAQTRAQLTRLKPARVVLAGGPAAVSEAVAGQIRAVTGTTPSRVYGKTATGTAAALNRAYASRWKDATAILVTSKGHADAVSAAAVAYAKHYPVFMSESSSKVSAETLAAMKACGVKRVVLVGGEKALSKNVESQIRSAGLTVYKRVWGSNALATSKAVANWGISLGMSANNMGVATSAGFADALCGSVFCGSKGSVLVLATKTNAANASVAKANKARIANGYVFGGTGAISAAVFNAFSAATA